ncbi:MAG: hypothetical protein FWG44_08465 [Oscillospiraceae bacterium]|nr:hypothetical protein [Oscillospiraceae bacterium]
MTLKSKVILTLVLAAVLTAGLIALLSFAFFSNPQFPMWSTLALLGSTVIAIIAWVFYYMALSKYRESLNPRKHKYFKKGNRKESRKGTKSRTKSRTR